MNASPVPVPSVTFASPLLSKQFSNATCPTSPSSFNFAFARIQGDVRLIQLVGQSEIDISGTPSLDIHIFRHEFVSIFRYSHSVRTHPLDIRVLEPIDDHALRYEQDNGTVFLAKDLMAHLKRIMDASALLKATTTRRGRQRC